MQWKKARCWLRLETGDLEHRLKLAQVDLELAEMEFQRVKSLLGLEVSPYEMKMKELVKQKAVLEVERLEEELEASTIRAPFDGESSVSMPGSGCRRGLPDRGEGGRSGGAGNPGQLCLYSADVNKRWSGPERSWSTLPVRGGLMDISTRSLFPMKALPWTISRWYISGWKIRQ